MKMQAKTDKKTGETLYYKKDDSGLSVYIMPRHDYSTSFAIFGTRYGSVDSKFIVPGEKDVTEVPDGIAHYLEHKMFDMPDGTNIFDKFSKLGANANAFTTFNSTAYLFSATNNIKENLEILLDYVQTPYFTDESVQKEQGIIGQEIKMYDDNGAWKVFFNLLAALYHNHPVKKDIAGTVESISKIDADTLYKCYNTFYNLSNMTLFVTGDFDICEIEEVIDKSIKKKKPFTEEIKKIYPDEPKSVARSYISQKLSVAMPLFMIGFKDTDNGYDGDRLLKKHMEISILNKMLFGRGSKFFKSMSDLGLINDSFNTDYSAQPDYGFSTIEGESKDPDAVYAKVLEHIAFIGKTGLSHSDYERVKKVMWGDYIRSYNDVEEYSHAFLNMHMMGIDYTHYQNVYDSLSFEELKERFKIQFTKDNAAISVILPSEE